MSSRSTSRGLPLRQPTARRAPAPQPPSPRGAWRATASLAALAGAALALAACGGGGEATPAALQLEGTAAVGHALAQASIRARCLDGQGQAVTAQDGRYVLRIEGARAPCLLEVQPTAAGGRSLHAVATGAPAALTVNLTPLTELQATRVLRGLPADAFAGFDGRTGAAALVTPAALKAAQADVTSALADVVDASAVADFVASPLKAATPQSPDGGDAHDKLLDQLGNRLNTSRFQALQLALAGGQRPDDSGAFVPRLAIQGPAVQSVDLGGTLQLMADMNYRPEVMYIRQPVSWQLDAPTLGSIDRISGRYQAPEQAGSVQVRAVRDDYPAVQATVTVQVRPWATLDAAAFSSVTQPETAVVRDAAAWAALWARHAPQRPLPEVDFTQATVLAVFAGSQNNGCAGIGFTALHAEAGGLVAEYRRSDPPAAGTACPAVITTPAHLVRVPRVDGAVRFVDRSGT